MSESRLQSWNGCCMRMQMGQCSKHFKPKQNGRQSHCSPYAYPAAVPVSGVEHVLKIEENTPLPRARACPHLESVPVAPQALQSGWILQPLIAETKRQAADLRCQRNSNSYCYCCYGCWPGKAKQPTWESEAHAATAKTKRSPRQQLGYGTYFMQLVWARQQGRSFGPAIDNGS
jgi:hypothetical protein